MKIKFTRILLVFSAILSFALVFPPAVYAQSGTGDDQLILGQSFTLESGKVQEGSFIVFGGTLTIKNGARVNGDIFVAGGSLDIEGTVQGTVSSLGSYVNIGDSALLQKDLAVVGGTINRSDKATILGHVDISSGEKFSFNRPTDILGSMPRSPILFDLGPIKDAFGAMTRVLGLTALAALMMLFLVKPVIKVADAAVQRPLFSFLVGLISFILVPALMVLLIITLILSPFGLLGLLLLGLAILFGWVAVGYEIGKRITASLKLDWAAPITAGTGVLVLSIISELCNFIPCIGWIVPSLVGLLGLGAVVISRFGTQEVTQTRPPSPLPPHSPNPPYPPSPRIIAESQSGEEQTETPVA